MHKFRLINVCLCLMTLMLVMTSQAWSQSSQVIMDPLCVAEYCPGCHQPLDMAYADGNCRRCVNSNLTKIFSCAKNQKQALDKAFVGLWRTPAGLIMAVKQNPQGFWGVLEYVPEKLLKHYQVLGMEVIKAHKTSAKRYEGTLLAPSGRWIEASFNVSGDKMISDHPGGKSIHWRKTIRVHTPNNAAMEPGGLGNPGKFDHGSSN